MPHSLFISDLHLSADQPCTLAAFQRFVADVAPQADALYVLGDLFEAWVGDDDLSDSFHAQVIGAFRNLAEHGVKIFLLHGNRDFLMGEALVQACHAKLLPDPVLVDVHGTPTLLSHGDALCTGDTAYLNYRAQVRAPDFQQQFLAKPLAERKAYAAQLRARSKHEKEHKDSMLMDVSEPAVAALLRQYGYPRLIHGHTHRPARHELMVDGHACERWVLGDWDREGMALRCDAQGCDVLRF